MISKIIIAAIIACLISLGIGFYWGQSASEKEHAIALQEQKDKAIKQEHVLAGQKDAIIAQLQNENEHINTKLLSALNELYNRPERLSTASRISCKGATGAELSRADAGFLIREAARGDTFRAAIKACYEWNDKVKEACNHGSR